MKQPVPTHAGVGPKEHKDLRDIARIAESDASVLQSRAMGVINHYRLAVAKERFALAHPALRLNSQEDMFSAAFSRRNHVLVGEVTDPE